MAHHRALLRLFAASCACGFLLGLLHGGPQSQPPPPPQSPPPPLPPAGDLAALYPAWLRRQGLSRAPRGPGRPDSASEAGTLSERVSVLCAVREDEARRGAEAVRRTWMPRCSGAVSYGRLAADSVTGSAAAGPARLRTLLRRLHGRLTDGGHHWLLLATDTSFVVMPNLRRLVAALSPDEPHYLGQPAAVAGRHLNLAAAGLLLSRAAVQLLHRAETQGRFRHLHPALAEEAALGDMLSALSITPVDTRDALGRPRFLPVPPSALHQPSSWLRLRPLWQHSAYPLTEETMCCSSEVVSFGRVAWSRVYLLEYLIHHVTTEHGTSLARHSTTQ